MSVYILLILSVVRVWADQQPTITLPNNSDKTTSVLVDKLLMKQDRPLTSEFLDKNGSECVFPFEKIGKNCYYFSQAKQSYDNALNYCKSLTNGHTHEIFLAMLDYSSEEDQDLLNAVASKDTSTFWVGGNTTDGINWEWVDKREVDLRAPFWDWEDPREEKCIVAQSYDYRGNSSRSYLYTHKCDDSLNFICQIGCPVSFKRIGNYCYMRSEDFGLPHLTWNEASAYCASLSVPEGYHANLAVLGLQDQDGYTLINTLGENIADYIQWIGAFQEEGKCKYMWVDGRELSDQSMYWYKDEPICDFDEDYDVALFDDGDYNRPLFIQDYEDDTLPFICQIFKEN